MAIIKAVNSRASIGRAIDYITKEEKTEQGLTYGKDCNPNTAIDEMKATKELHGKTGGREYVHLVQSFDPSEKLSFEKAHEVGKEFIESCEKYKGHEVLMATHMDKGHIHNHFIINSVNYENSKKLSTSKHELQQIKDINDSVCKEHGLSIAEPKKEIVTAYNKEKYKALEKGFEGKGKSYVLDTALAVSDTLEKATSREEFIKGMNEKGYEVNWKDTRKNITFENSDGKKVRNSNLEKTFNDNSFSKESMEQKFKENLRTKELSMKIEKSTKVEPIKDMNIVSVIAETVKSVDKANGIEFEVQRQNETQQQGKERVRERER